MDAVTYETLRKINLYYNPLGETKNFLVDKFLDWCEMEGSYWWIWDGALQYSSSKMDPKSIIKNLPFISNDCNPDKICYRSLLVDEWLKFINSDPLMIENIMKERRILEMTSRAGW